MRVLVTGGAGFVGSTLALMLKAAHAWQVTAFDNLRRRGSELAMARLRSGGVDFVHGDIRNPEDLDALPPFDLIIECSAEPSVHAGYGGDPRYLVHTNLLGTFHCLELARRTGASVIFLSTSRVYSIKALRDLPLAPAGQRFVLNGEGPGWSTAGISEAFSTGAPRSLYGATKLASEMLIEEYGAMYGVKAIVNRCGVIAGPWQMGKVDQGFIVLWAARHLFGGALKYTGFGGTGHQVRDVLHAADLFDLVERQIADLPRQAGKMFNVGGGAANSLSLTELTALCVARAGRTIDIGADVETKPADIPYYVSDCRAIAATMGWAPRRSLDCLMDDVFDWLRDHRRDVEAVLA